MHQVNWEITPCLLSWLSIYPLLLYNKKQSDSDKYKKKCHCTWQEVHEWNMAAATSCKIEIILIAKTMLLGHCKISHQYTIEVEEGYS